MTTFWKPNKGKITSVKQSYWKKSKVPIYKQKNDDSRMRYRPEPVRVYKEGPIQKEHLEAMADEHISKVKEHKAWKDHIDKKNREYGEGHDYD